MIRKMKKDMYIYTVLQSILAITNISFSQSQITTSKQVSYLFIQRGLQLLRVIMYLCIIDSMRLNRNKEDIVISQIIINQRLTVTNY